jgi:hypothetical protein
MRNRALVLFAVLLMAMPMIAKIGTIDVVPASTLLYPYFEVDVDHANGVNTLLTVQNASATAILVNFTLWTDYGIPTANFNVYLTGYDAETISLREVFKRLSPRTASAGQDPTDTLSPHGPISQDINFASCNGYIPDTQDSFISPQLAAAHRGQQSTDFFGPGNCGGFNYGDGIARGFITADAVNQCTLAAPTAPGYFVNGGGGIATLQNVLMGDMAILDVPNERVFADNAVHIEASGTDPLTQFGDYTFYSRFTPSGGGDNREALPTAWAGRYSANRTTLGYWRDPGAVMTPFPCGGAPAGFPLDQKQIRGFGPDGNVVATNAGARFPIASGETAASGASGLGLTSALGWTFLNLNLPTNVIRQSWVSFNHVPPSAPTNATVGYTVPGFALGSASTGDNPTLP